MYLYLCVCVCACVRVILLLLLLTILFVKLHLAVHVQGFRTYTSSAGMSWNMPYLVPPPPEVVVTGGQLAARPDHDVSELQRPEVREIHDVVNTATLLPHKHHRSSLQCWSFVERLLAMG